MQSMGFVTLDTMESVKMALTNGDKENQTVCIYHLLAKKLQKSPRIKPVKKDENNRRDDDLRRTRSASVGSKTPKVSELSPSKEKTEKKKKESTLEKESILEKEKETAPRSLPVPTPSGRSLKDSARKRNFVVSTPNRNPNSYEETSVVGNLLSSSSPRVSPRDKTSRNTSPKKQRAIKESTPEKIRARSASFAPKSKRPESPKKTPLPAKKPERPILSLNDISSGNIKSSSASTSPQPIPRAKTPRGSLTTLFAFASSPESGSPTDENEDEKALPIELKTKLVSVLSASDLHAEIERVLIFLKFTFKKKGDVYKCSTRVEDCAISFSIEVIKVSSTRAVKIKRLAGQGFGYKMVHENLVSELRL
jgi:hypothetical protein